MFAYECHTAPPVTTIYQNRPTFTSQAACLCSYSDATNPARMVRTRATSRAGITSNLSKWSHESQAICQYGTTITSNSAIACVLASLLQAIPPMRMTFVAPVERTDLISSALLSQETCQNIPINHKQRQNCLRANGLAGSSTGCCRAGAPG